MSVSGAVHLQELFPQVETQEIKGWMSTYGRTRRKEDHNKHGFNLTLFYVRFSSIWNETDSFLSQEQIEIWLNQSPLLCCSIKGHIFVDLQITDKFHSQKSIIIFGVSNYKIVQKKRKIWISLSKVSTFTCERVCSLLTVMCKYRVWLGCKMGNWKK